jgi:protein-disulfide isomerase
MKSQYALPITIVLAGVLIAGAVFLVGKSGGGANTPAEGTPTVRPVDASQDWILGNPNAPVMLVEYADLECQFCKEFHTTMHQVMEYYGTEGQVAWVFRHFPLVQLHPKAAQEAHAAECAGEQGGADAFFRYIDRVYQVTPSNNGLDLAQLPVIAGDVGLDVNAFTTCMESNRHQDKISASYSEAIDAGGRGTPYTLVLVNGELVEGGALGGAQPYDSMRAIVDTVLQQLSGAPILQTP